MTDQKRPYYNADQARIIDQHHRDRISLIKRLLGFGTCEVRIVSDENMKYIAEHKPHGRKQDEE